MGPGERTPSSEQNHGTRQMGCQVLRLFFPRKFSERAKAVRLLEPRGEITCIYCARRLQVYFFQDVGFKCQRSNQGSLCLPRRRAIHHLKRMYLADITVEVLNSYCWMASLSVWATLISKMGSPHFLTLLLSDILPVPGRAWDQDVQGSRWSNTN